MSAEEGLAQWLRRLTLRSALNEHDRATILQLPGRLDRVRANHDIVGSGDIIDASCLIVGGTAGRYGQTRDGRRQYTAFYIPGDMGDLHSAMLPKVSYPMAALADALVLRVPHAALLAAAARSPAIANAFWRDCVVDAAVASAWLLNNGQRDARSRLAHLLCELSLRFETLGATRTAFPLPFTQAHIGEALGLTAVHVNRTLRALREAGLLTVRADGVTIPDWLALAAVADFDAEYLHRARQPVAEPA